MSKRRIISMAIISLINSFRATQLLCATGLVVAAAGTAYLVQQLRERAEPEEDQQHLESVDDPNADGDHSVSVESLVEPDTDGDQHPIKNVFEVSLDNSISIVLFLAKKKEEMTELSPNGFPVHTRLTRESTTIKLVAGKVVCYASICIVDIAECSRQTDLAAWAFVMGLGLDGVLVTYHWADIRTKIQPKERNQHDSQGDRATKHSRLKLKALVQDFSRLISQGKKHFKQARAIILGRLRIANKRDIRAPSTGSRL